MDAEKTAPQRPASDPAPRRPWHPPRLVEHGPFRTFTRGVAGGHKSDQHFGGAMPSA